MRTLLLLSLLVPLSCLAQRPVTVDDFRIVDGQLYNTRYSKKWLLIPDGLWSLKVQSVTTNGVMVQEYQRTFTRTSPPNTALQGTFGAKPPEGFWQEHMGKEYVLKHYDGEATTGKVITGRIRVMKAGTIEMKGNLLMLFDCGLPNTPENRKALTNSPPASGS